MRAKYPLKPTRTIRDPLHGDINFTEEELQVIDHALFRRMHRIRQNGLLYLVFPSATHTRFEHSLGTVHVADSMLRSLLFNAHVATEKPTSAVAQIGDGDAGQAVDFNDLDHSQLQYIFRITRLAALVHDLGHGPFSHHFDAFAPKAHRIQELIEDTATLTPLAPLSRALQTDPEDNNSLFTTRAPSRVEHEVMSCVLFTYLWDDIDPKDENTPADVAATILRRPDLASDRALSEFLPLMSDVVTSAPADADRMDYLERDSRSVGVTYGLFDRNRLLKSLLPYKRNDTDNGVRYHLGFKKSGLPAVENFVQARFELFAQIYYHKTNRAVQLMLTRIAENASGKDVQLYRWSNLDELGDVYLKLTDEKFLDVLEGSDSKLDIDDRNIRRLASEIRDRSLWKRIYEGPLKGTQLVYRRLEEEGLTDALIKDTEADPDATKGLDEGAPLLRRDEGGIYAAQDQKSWREASPIIEALAEGDTIVARIYLTESNRERAKQIKDRVRNHLN